MDIWQEFVAGIREGWRPFRAVIPRLLGQMAISAALVLLGLGAIVLGKLMAPPESDAMIFLGEGLLMGGAGFGIVVTINAWLALIRAAGFLEIR